MPHSQAQCRLAAEALLNGLMKKNLVSLQSEGSSVAEKISQAFMKNFHDEAAIEKEAERLADAHIQSEPEVDRHRVIKMIKQRLAEERNFVL